MNEYDGYGLHIEIKHPDGSVTSYAHHALGEIRDTGNSSGPHLHFEVRSCPET